MNIGGWVIDWDEIERLSAEDSIPDDAQPCDVCGSSGVVYGINSEIPCEFCDGNGYIREPLEPARPTEIVRVDRNVL